MADATREVVLDRRAAKELAALPPSLKPRFLAALDALAVDPFTARPGCDLRVVQGRPGLRALRVGQHRAIYLVQGPRVLVLLIGHRRNIYDL